MSIFVWAVLVLAAGGIVFVFGRLSGNRRRLVDESAEREKARGEKGWWWLSFVDPDRTDGERFLGVSIVEGYDVESASHRAHELGVNPGGEVCGESLSGEAIPPAEYRNRLLSKADLEVADLIDKPPLSETDDPELVEAVRATMPCFDFESLPLDEDTLVITCRGVWANGEPVRYVSHDDVGFQFLCGGNEHTSAEEAVSVHARHLFEREPDQLRDFTYLRKGCFAQHIADDKWNLGNLSPEDT